MARRGTGGEAADTRSRAPGATPAQPLEVALGMRVRALRRARDLTAVALARAAGISVATVSKIEKGSISTSLSTLQALARALDVPIAELLSDVEDRRDCSLVRAGEGVTIDRRGTTSGHRYTLLGHALRGAVAVEPYLITLERGAEPYSRFRHAGIEFLYVLEGRLTYRHGDHHHPLGPGDAMMFDAAALHGPHELVELPARFLSVIMYPQQR